MSPGMTTSAVPPSEHDSSTMLRTIPLADLKSDYLPSLVHTLPHSMCQLGLTMTSLYIQEKCQAGGGNTTMIDEFNKHFRSIPFPSRLAGHEADPPTVFDLTMARAARICYFTSSSEERLTAAMAAHGLDYTSMDFEESERNKSEQAHQEIEAKIQADPFIQEQFQIFQTVAREVVRLINEGVDADTAVTPVHFFGVNQIWRRAVVSLYPMHSDGPSVKFIISEMDLLAAEPALHTEMQTIANRKGWTFGPMQKSDIPLMIERNGIKYDVEYAEHVIERSICFRDQNGAMIAWAGTHQDSVAALHVLPEYRKEGLGRLILLYLNLSQIKRLREYLVGTDQETVDPCKLYMHADTVAENTPTQKFMLRCGYRIASRANWFTLTPVEKTE
ncbi:hypothetical protein BGW41_003226 [Actinomortierella wolfii]|nr:hypothetical protein BGW41_003226 [Actinomortierella wolfii]